MNVKDLMSTNISCITEDSPIALIAQQMRREDVGSLPVCSQQGQLIGMITDRDLVLRALAKATADPSVLSSLTAKDIMTLHPVTVPPDMSSHDAALLFSSHGVRRLPVTENEKLVGMLSLGDLASRPVCIDEAGDVISAISLAPGRD